MIAPLLAAVPLVEPLGPAPRILDIGSGAGFPGIPVAVVAGSSRTLLVEPRQRRASFLRAVARRLPGFGVEVADRPVTVPDLFATFCASLGIDGTKENMSSTGRPIKLVDGGEPVRELL